MANEIDKYKGAVQPDPDSPSGNELVLYKGAVQPTPPPPAAGGVPSGLTLLGAGN